jgi:hypothetical protein
LRGTGVSCESGAQQVEGVDALARVRVSLLLDYVPLVVAPWRRAEAESPRDMETTTDVANRAVENLEFFRVPEPISEALDDLRRAV